MILKSRRIPAAVVALGAVSFFTDLSSEMIYPLLPLFLASVLGASATALGVIEGVAETTAALLKIVSGVWTDRTRRRKPLILLGYGVSGCMRPLIGLATGWPVVLLLRFADRVGKGLRTSPRDAMIADVTEPYQRGAAYGLHRAMDHAGAATGPLVAAALLSFAGIPLRGVFLLAAIPSVLVMIVLLGFVKEPRQREVFTPPPVLREHWRELGHDFRRLLASFLVFTLGNSTDAFLLLRMSDAGISAAGIAALWSAHHLVKMASTWIGGRLSDSLGRRGLIITGWMLYAGIYLAFGWFGAPAVLVILFLVYGVYFGLTEPVEKAWISELVPTRLRGVAFGYYHCTIGLAALPASVIFGLLWQTLGASVAFTTGAGLAVIAAGMLHFAGNSADAE